MENMYLNLLNKQNKKCQFVGEYYNMYFIWHFSSAFDFSKLFFTLRLYYVNVVSIITLYNLE